MHSKTPTILLCAATLTLPALILSSWSCASGDTDVAGGGAAGTPWTTTTTSGGSGPVGGGGAGAQGATGGAGANGGEGGGGGDGATGGTGGSAGSGGFGGAGGSGGSGGAGGSGGQGGQGSLYSHTIPIGPPNPAFEFNTGQWAGLEAFATTTAGFTAYYAWDAQYFYVGLTGPDIGPTDGSAGNKWVVLYLDGTPSTPTGETYQAQTPALPFEAHWQFQWQANNALTVAKVWDGGDWVVDAGWNFTGDVYLSTTAGDQWLEMRFPRSELGSPSTLAAHLSIIDEGANPQWTYSGVPSTSFTDGTDPDYGAFFNFDLSGAEAPTDHGPQ